MKPASHRDWQCSEIEPLEGRKLLASPLVSVANAVVRERGAGQVSYAQVTVSLARRATSVVRIGFATKAGTATAGTDFVAASGTLTIPVGSSSGNIRLKINGDAVLEGTEKFYLRLTSAIHATLPTPAPYSIVRILDSVPTNVPISNNLSASSTGVQGAGLQNMLAASFIAPANAEPLKQVILLMGGFLNTEPVVGLNSDAGGSPGSRIVLLDRASPNSSTLAPTKFVKLIGVPLVPNRKYWIVLSGTGGGLEWAFTSGSSGSGSGFTGEWANSVNGGASWVVSKNSPLQMQVGGT